MQIRRQHTGLAHFAVTLLLAACARGADVVWTGGGNDLQWGNTANWSTLALPGVGDRVLFHGPSSLTSGYGTNAIIHLGANRTITEFRLMTNAVPFVLTGDGSYSLTITNGAISGDLGVSTPQNNAYVLDCDVNIGANATWVGHGQFGSFVGINGTVSDGGHGYAMNFSGDQNRSLVLNGAVLLSSTVTLTGASCTLGGQSGAMTNVDIHLMPLPPSFNTADAVLSFNNNSYTNGDRFGDNRIIHNYSVGAIRMVGHGVNPVSETIGTALIESGVLTLENDYYGTNVELVVTNLVRPAGSALLAWYYQRSGTQTPGTNTKIRIAGESANTNGIWRPWAIARNLGAAGSLMDGFLRVDATGCLVPLAASDYTVLPASGSVPTAVHRASAASLSLTASEEVFGLRMDYLGNQVLDLGANDLTIGCGTLLFGSLGAKTITSSGGRLVFRTNEIFIAGQLGNSGSNLVIHAPLASTATGPAYLCIGDLGYVNTFTLDGADEIGTYAGLTAVLRVYQAVLKLGGPSDRTFNGPLVGQFSLALAGSGTLRLNGRDWRTGNSTDIQAGRVIVGHSLALPVNAATNFVFVRSGARLEIASNVTWSGNFTADTNSTIGGDGTLGYGNPNLIPGVHIAPGGGVGKLTTGNLTLKTGSVIEWQLGAATNNAGTDYDLLHVAGNLTLPGATSNLVLQVSDANAGRTRANGARFTVADWTGTTAPSTAQSWIITNASPATLDTSLATVQVNTADKKIYLSGVKTLGPRGTGVFVR